MPIEGSRNLSQSEFHGSCHVRVERCRRFSMLKNAWKSRQPQLSQPMAKPLKFPGLRIWVFPKIMVPPKSSILIGFSMINHPFWGSNPPIFGSTPIYYSYQTRRYDGMTGHLHSLRLGRWESQRLAMGGFFGATGGGWVVMACHFDFFVWLRA